MSEIVWPLDPADAHLPIEWSHSATDQILIWLWKAYDQLCTKLMRVDFTQGMEQLERDLTERHFLELQNVWAQDTKGRSSLQPSRESPELLSRKPPPAMAPAYDFAFVHTDDQLWKWPIEAKLIKSPIAVSEYVSDVRDKFEAGVAAPITGEGGMIGYLLKGDASLAFERLALALDCMFIPVVEFSGRNHRATFHLRIGSPPLRLHHLLMKLN